MPRFPPAGVSDEIEESPMSSASTQAARAAVNRANARHSTGPKTEEGKNRSRFNALRHGLTSQTVILPGEDTASYTTLRRRLFEDLQPKGEYEEQLVQTIVDSTWRLNRAAAAEANMLAHYLHEREGSVSTGDPAIDDAMILGDVYRSETRMLASMALCSQRIEKLRRNARQELEALQKARKFREMNEMSEAARLRKLHGDQPFPYDPAEDGFVFSLSEIDTYIRRSERRKEAGILIGAPSFRIFPRPARTQAAGHPLYVVPDPSERKE
jgi:hypothetical protein